MHYILKFFKPKQVLPYLYKHIFLKVRYCIYFKVNGRELVSDHTIELILFIIVSQKPHLRGGNKIHPQVCYFKSIEIK